MEKHYRFEFEMSEASAYDWTFDRRVQSTWAMTADLAEGLPLIAEPDFVGWNGLRNVRVGGRV